MKMLSIRWRLSLFFAIAVAGIVVVFGIVLILITRQQLLARTDAALREELREILLEVDLHQSVVDFQKAAQTLDFIITTFMTLWLWMTRTRSCLCQCGIDGRSCIDSLRKTRRQSPLSSPVNSFPRPQ